MSRFTEKTLDGYYNAQACTYCYTVEQFSDVHRAANSLIIVRTSGFIQLPVLTSVLLQ